MKKHLTLGIILTLVSASAYGWQRIDRENTTSKFDLSLGTTVHEGEIICNFEYCSKLFKRETVEKFASSF